MSVSIKFRYGDNIESALQASIVHEHGQPKLRLYDDFHEEEYFLTPDHALELRDLINQMLGETQHPQIESTE